MNENLHHSCRGSVELPPNSEAVNQLSRHKRQPAPILQSEGIVVMDRLNRRRAE
jgi:hypothetical protein